MHYHFCRRSNFPFILLLHLFNFLLLVLLYTLFLRTLFNYSPYQMAYTNFNETDLQSATRVCNSG